tara:strand:+ start:851 stop:1597 length:747 start_codon:yes stop_codon:yes gene_type:complete
MELLIKGLDNILDDKLSLVERGILISIALCRDNDKRMTLAKFKTKCKISTIKLELINLQESGLIRWSGYKAAKKSIEDNKMNPDVIDIINFMNGLYNRDFNPNSAASTTNLKNRLKEHNAEDIKLVVANRYKVWKDDVVMESNLNPGTIFRPSKFSKYLEEAKRTRVGESFVAAENISLKNGDEITSEVVNSFINNDTYNIKIYQTDGEGNKRASGVGATRYGKDIKKMLKLQKLNSIRTHRYFYVAK